MKTFFLFSAVRPLTSSNIQFLNTTSNSTVRPIIFNQKGTTSSGQPQLLTVMPAGVRVQQLTPVVRGSSNQSTTIVRLMQPTSSTIRTNTGQQQFIQLNTNKQQQPLVIKAITTSGTNRQQQPILLAANTQQKTILPQNQQQQHQQVLVLNQNTFNNNQGQLPKFTVQMAHVDNNPPETTTKDTTIPQLDGTVDDQVRRFLI